MTSPWTLPPLHNLSDADLMSHLSTHRDAVLREIYRRICERENTRRKASS